MKAKVVLLSTIWIITLIVTYVIGSTMTTSDQETADSSLDESSARTSYRSQSRRYSTHSKSEAGSARRQSSRSTKASSCSDITDIISQNNPIARMNQFMTYLNKLGPNDFEQAVIDFKSTGLSGQRYNEYRMILLAWGKKDPLAALDYTTKNTKTSYEANTVLTSWAVENPDAAIQ